MTHTVYMRRRLEQFIEICLIELFILLHYDMSYNMTIMITINDDNINGLTVLRFEY